MVDDGLVNGQRLVDVAQSVQRLLLRLDGDVELPTTLEVEHVVLGEDLHGGPHELGQVRDIGGHGGEEEADPDVCGGVANDTMWCTVDDR